jgi:hypothetical protein
MLNKNQLSFAEGWTVFCQARTVFVALVIIAMVINLGIFGTARFAKNLITYPQVPVFCGLPGMPCPTTGPATTTQKAGLVLSGMGMKGMIKPFDLKQFQFPPVVKESKETIERNQRSKTWETIFTGLMTFTGILALVGAIFLAFSAVIGIMMIIAGQLPGAGLVSGAFFWAAGLVALLLPWATMLPEASCLPVGVASFGDMYNAIYQTRFSTANWWTEVALWLRYVLYPVIILLMTWMYFQRTGRANTQILTEQTVGAGQ